MQPVKIHITNRNAAQPTRVAPTKRLGLCITSIKRMMWVRQNSGMVDRVDDLASTVFHRPNAVAMPDPILTIAIDFEPVRTATQDASEEARLVRFNQHIVAVLLPAETGWFLQMGFGPCEQEGLVFQSLTAAEIWVRACLQGAAISSVV